MGTPYNVWKVVKAILVVLLILVVALVVVGIVYGAITGNVFGLFEFSLITSFFDGFTAEQLVFGLIMAAFTLIPQVGLKFFNWLKNQFGMADKAAHDLIYGVCFVVSAVALLVTGALDIGGLEFNIANLVVVWNSIYGLSQLAYKRLYPELAKTL